MSEPLHVIDSVSRSQGQVTIRSDQGVHSVLADSPEALVAMADENAARRRRQWNAGLTREQLYRQAAEAWQVELAAEPAGKERVRRPKPGWRR